MSRELEAVVRISGNIDARLKSAIDAAVKRLDQLEAAAKESGGAVGELADKIKDQSSELKAAQKQYASYVLAGEEGTEQAQELAAKIKELSSDLNANKSSLAAAEKAAQRLADGLDDAEDSADGAGDGLDDVGDSARGLKDGFTVAKGAMADLVSSGFQKLISSAGDAVRALFELSDATREFRQDQSTLETAFDKAGFASETATKTWKDMYAIFGEDDRAVEAANNISRMSKSQAELDSWVRITTGIWGSYQDALPVEGLAEAAGETAKVGKVTGPLADALNWSSEAAAMFADYMGDDVTNAEDAFNVALSKCSNEQERQALITETLTALYGDAADKYVEVSGSLMDANGAAADAQLAQARLGEIIEPVTTAWTILKTELMNAVAPALEKVSQGLQGVIQWMQEHPTVVQALATALGVLVAGITAVTIAVGIYTGVQMLANAAMLPVIGIALAIVAGLAAVIAIGVALYNNWDTIKAKAGELWATISAKFQAIGASIRSIWTGIVSYLSGVWASIKAKASEFVSSVKSTISSGWSALTSILTAPFRAVSSVIDSVKSKVSGLLGSISSVGSSIASHIPGFATGGFTNGLSFAGEDPRYPTEAVISFNPAYRAQNLSYWAEAGRMLGADDSFALSGGTSATYVELGNVNFAPNITVKGNAKKDDIVAAIRETYPEFMDLLDELISERGETVYA